MKVYNYTFHSEKVKNGFIAYIEVTHKFGDTTKIYEHTPTIYETEEQARNEGCIKIMKENNISFATMDSREDTGGGSMKIREFLKEFFNEYIDVDSLKDEDGNVILGDLEDSDLNIWDPESPHFINGVDECEDWEDWGEDGLKELLREVYQEVFDERMTEMGYECEWIADNIAGRADIGNGYWLYTPADN